MKVVLFCAGQGTRIRDYSQELPKPMIPIDGQPILSHVMEYYSSYGHPTPLPAPTTPPAAATGDSDGWKIAAIGAGAFVLALGAAELVTLGRLRRATAG